MRNKNFFINLRLKTRTYFRSEKQKNEFSFCISLTYS